MIERVIGPVIEKTDNYVVILVAGLGYKVHVSSTTLSKCETKKEIELFTSLIVRENLMDLYGFLSKEELGFFELLIGVSGIGPKGGLGILNQATPAELVSSISSGEYSVLTNVSGIGKKTAERIVLELKNKIGSIDLGISATGDKDSKAKITDQFEAIEALIALGYNANEAREALKQVPSEVTDIGEKVKTALKLLAK